MSYEAKVKELGITIPDAPKPVAAYVAAVRDGNYVYTSGQIPFVAGELKFKGKLGKDLSVEQGYEAAKTCAINCLAAIKGQIESLDNIEKVVKIVGFVSSSPEFYDQPKVINGASELVGSIFGKTGEHARSAVGVAELPLNAAVEVEMVVKVK
ncbi:RidA family protein [Sporomusa acidovorans]|uniref:Endoribonuclease L-PSP/chorismate mutase-like domain-containing protein n=1 Tax=Sporomusa acidovorans (strain ATCC 49682 / DSM 3132 / Mol) TaxID=1123286 RepID=A0ABZ3J3V9_SPOA4|nr:RidA family protein [Sporomusa acidovorans]OZC20293.1 endoribonuclease L-PSP [Sporomusa acidovorans DSM 3132]SDD38995.1 Enamine deaminase RidA, house cleaning of reactive enamine intermediates, YjgF/YER057c/UK114 family [Sporomusa acidovorans]